MTLGIKTRALNYYLSIAKTPSIFTYIIETKKP